MDSSIYLAWIQPSCGSTCTSRFALISFQEINLSRLVIIHLSMYFQFGKKLVASVLSFKSRFSIYYDCLFELKFRNY